MSARFSYIDDEGREVEIGGSAQLLERIREGTIDGSTQIFDAASGRWSPAAEHPVFKELAGTLEAEGEAPAVQDAPDSAQPSRETAEDDEAAGVEEEAVADEEDEGGFGGVDFGLTLTGGGDTEEAEPGAEVEEEGGAEDFDLGDFTLASGEEEAATGDDQTAEEGEEEEEEEEEASFDFGSEPLELESGPEEEEEEEEEELSTGAGGGMSLESPLDRLGVDDEGGSGGGGGFEDGSLVSGAAEEDWSRSGDADDWNDPTELEPEVEEEQPPRPPARSRSGGESPEPEDEERPPKRARPERPAAKEPGSISIVTILVVAAVLAGGGWAGYTFLLAGPKETAEVTGPGPDPRTLRTVPPELQGPIVSVAEDAMGDVAVWIRDLSRSHGVPERPPQEWLDGIYLANASRYPGVEEFFSSVSALLDDVRSGASTHFEEAYDEALAETDLTEDQKEQLRAWLEEDMTWSQARRDTVYDAMGEVVGAALDLHALLVEREDDIGYQLMEAVPSDPSLQEAIDRHLDRITSSLDTLDALGQVTATRFREILVANLRDTLVPPAQPQGNS